MNISGLIAAYGYWAVFALVAAESHGIPLPGETALIIAAAYAGHTHQLSPWIIFAVASAGTVTGDNIGFWIGHKGGYRLARRYGPKVRLDERKLKIAHYLFDTHGPKVVFLARFASMLRTYAAFLAGTSRMRWHRFLLANAAGAIAWAGSYTPAAYLAGDALRRLSGTIDLVIGGAAGLGLAAALLLILRRHTGTLALRAESRPPRPAQLTGLVMDDARCEAVFATGKQRPEPGAPGAGRVAQATVHPSPDHHRPARSPSPSCMASQRYHQAGAPTGPPAQPARRWRCIMCQHQPPCPPADATDRQAAHVVASHPEQGWSLLCNGTVLFEDTGVLLPGGQSIPPHRAAVTNVPAPSALTVAGRLTAHRAVSSPRPSAPGQRSTLGNNPHQIHRTTRKGSTVMNDFATPVRRSAPRITTHLRSRSRGRFGLFIAAAACLFGAAPPAAAASRPSATYASSPTLTSAAARRRRTWP